MRVIISCILLLFLASCSSSYYSIMESTLGKEKRDILVDRVENSRDSQQDAQVQFESALEQFQSVVKLEETDLKIAYEKLNNEYELSKEAADDVSARISKVESVSEDLFDEWKKELKLYDNKDLQKSSKEQLEATKVKYEQMLAKMKTAEASMEPVLTLFHDNVLYLKHNLNAQAVGSLQGSFAALENEISDLIANMSEAIKSSNSFIQEMQ